MSLNSLGLAAAARPERRHSARREVQSLVYLKISPNNGGILHDLGESGMRVSMANPLRMDTDCRFSIVRQKHPPIQGVGRVAWVSKSGKAAGLRFVELPDESRRQILQWLGSVTDDGEAAGNGGCFDNGEKEMKEASLPADAETTTPAKVSEASEMNLRTPLFFFPQQEMEDLPDTGSAGAEDATHPAENQPGDVEQVRLALAQKQEEKEDKKRKRREILYAVRVICMAALVLAGGLLSIYKGNYAYQYVRSHAPINLAFGHTRSIEPPPSRPAHAKRSSRRLRSSPREARAGGEDAATPAIWKAPKAKVPFQLEVTDSFNQRWLISASGQKKLSSGRPEITEDASAPTPSDAQPPATTDESADLTEPSENSAGPAEVRVRDGRTVEPEMVVAPKLGAGEKEAPFAVVLDALIGADGSVKDVHVVSSPSAALAWAVVEAVKQWHYPPFHRGGHPAEVVTQITVAFRGSPAKK